MTEWFWFAVGMISTWIVYLAIDGFCAWRKRRKLTRWMRYGPLDWR